MRVDLPLAFKHIWISLRPVSLVRCAYRLDVECICIRIYADALELSVDHTGDHVLECRVLVHIAYIWPYLRSRVAEPHCRDVTGVDEGVGLAVLALDRMDSSVKGIRVAVCEHPLKTWVLKHIHDPCDLFLYCI